jgi:hypothetical protein
MDHSDCHPNPHIEHHLRILTIPLAGQVGCQPLLCITSLMPCNAVHRVNHRCKVLPRFLTVLEILILLLLLVLLKNLCKVLFPVGLRVRVRNSHIEYGCTARSQNPWQLASPCSSVAAGGCGVSAVGGDEPGVAESPAATRTRRLTLEKILGSHSIRPGESAVPHKCRHSSATSSCRICTRPPVLHDRACSTVILVPQPLQAVSISSGEWLYRRQTLSLHSSADRPVPFNRLVSTKSHAPAAQFCLSHLATEGLSRP